MPPKRNRRKQKNKQSSATKEQSSATEEQISPPSLSNPEELPPQDIIEESISDSSTVDNDLQDQGSIGNSSFVTAYQDEVFINENEVLPTYIRSDHCLKKYVFQISKFDYITTIEEHNLNNEESVKKLTWNQFSSANSKLLHSFCKILFSFFKFGFSVKFMRNFCAVLAFNMPVCEDNFRRLKKKSSKGKLEPDLSKTSKQCESFADFLYARLMINSRYYVQKAAKENNVQLTVKRNNSELVAARNRNRKNTTLPSTTEE